MRHHHLILARGGGSSTLEKNRCVHLPFLETVGDGNGPRHYAPMNTIPFFSTPSRRTLAKRPSPSTSDRPWAIFGSVATVKLSFILVSVRCARSLRSHPAESGTDRHSWGARLSIRRTLAGRARGGSGAFVPGMLLQCHGWKGFRSDSIELHLVERRTSADQEQNQKTVSERNICESAILHVLLAC